MSLKWQDLVAIAIIVAAVLWFLRPKQRKAGCGCNGTKPMTAAPAQKQACSGGVALCGGR